MSKVNKKCFYIFAILILFSLFAFGCKSTSTPVERVDFDTNETGSQISLLVGDEYSPKINFIPSFATNKGYSLKSSDEEVLKISAQKIVAAKSGHAYLTVVADDNNAIQNTILVKVFDAPAKLGGDDIDGAINLHYNEVEKKFVFSEVLNAYTYTIWINGHEIELEHNLEFSLADYNQNFQAYNTELVAKVRANAPSYNHAIISSDYCTEIRIYQVGAVQNVSISADANGQSVLTFEHGQAKNFNVTINGESQPDWQNISNKSLSLMGLQARYAGQKVALQISALVDDEIRQQHPAALCYPSLSANYFVDVLAVPEISLNASTVVWSSIPFASGYEIFVDDIKQANTSTCSYNLNDLPNIVAGEVHTLRVEPVLTGANLAKTNKLSNVIKFGKNAAPTFTLENETLKWGVSDDKNYLVEVYKDDLLVESFATTNVEYSLDAIQDGVYKISVCELAKTENDIYYLTSEKTTMKIARLNTPRLTYNKVENKFAILDDNDEAKVERYLLTYNGGQQYFENIDLSLFNFVFEVGANEFSLTAIANGEVDGVNYLNSKPYNLTINKIENINKISISNEEFAGANFFNCLKVETGLAQEYKLNLTITISDNSINLLTENGALKDGEHNYVLPYVFDGGNYYIAMLNADYSLIIDELKNSEQTTANFNLSLILESDLENEISSNTIDATFQICGKTSIEGVGQKINITKVNLANLLENYYLSINNNLLVNLTSDLATVENENVVVDFAALAEKLAAEKIDLTKQIDIKVLNTYANSLLSVSDSFNCALAETPIITATKNVDMNSATEIAINVSKTDYTKQYIFKIYNEDKSVDETLTFNDETDAKFYLEKLEKYKNFKNEIYVSAYVSVLKQAEDFSVYYFNSLQTETLKFNKLQPVSNLKISNGILSFENANDNVAFYEIYSLITDQYTKLGTTISTNFDLTKFEISEKFNLAVVAVPNVEFNTTPEYTNSDYSEPISAQKVEINLTIENGDFVLTIAELKNLETLFSASEGSQAYLKVKNLNNEKTFVFSSAEQDAIDGLNIDFENNQIKLESYLILNYGEQVAEENLTFQIVVEYVDGEVAESFYYINSTEKNISVNGLIKPSSLSVNYATIDANEAIDFINWANEKNPLDLDYGYVLKLTYKGETYSSLDGIFESNGKPIDFDGNKIKLPTKFTKNNRESVDFWEGEYILQIKIYPLSKTPTTYCSSNYATAKIEILSAPSLSVENGNLIWERNDNAQGYQIKIEQDEQTIFLQTANTQFNFDSNLLNDITGVLSVQIQAISKIKNENDLDILKSVANSSWSEKLLVYKLSNLQTAGVDDGVLILTANKFFSTAEIDFVYNKTTSTYVYDNSKFSSQQLTDLGITSWQDLQEKSTTLTEARKYIIDLNVADKNNNKINLIEGITYSIFVRLTGNNYNAETELKLPIVSSTKTQANINLTRIKKADAKAIERGKLNFALDANYGLDDLNYNFNESEAALLQTENGKARVYKIDLSIGNKPYSILALDYNYFVEKIKTLTEENYHLYEGANNTLYGYLKLNSNGQEIYINVYENNILDFNQQTIYYNKIDITPNLEKGEFSYSMLQQTLSEIDVATGGNFIVDVSLLGGDRAEQNSANLTSPINEKYFVRYVANTLSTSNGELRFKDLTPLDNSLNPLDYPIYKIVASSVRGKNTFYLYYAKNDLQDVKNLVKDNDATFVEIKNYQQEENVKYVWFEISQLLEGATSYNLTIQTLAGLGVDDNAKYLLNTFKPSEPFNVYKYGLVTSDIDKTIGLRLKFNTIDSQHTISKFEIILTDTATNNDYVYLIDSSSENVKIVGNELLYKLPTKINVKGEDVELNSSYKFKVRARANDGEISQGLINGSYNNLSDFTIKHAEEIGDFAIENGTLKFATPKQAKQVYVQISYDVEGLTKYLYFTCNVNNDLEYQIYNFSDEPIYKNELNSNAEAIVADVNYKINIFALGFEDNSNYVLNGNFIVEDKELIRLPSVNRIFARNGVLTWDEVEGAVGYKILVQEKADLDLSSEQNSLDISDLDAGQYHISIIALGNEKINAQASAKFEFDKLAKVQKDSIELNDNTMSWQQVDGADKYYYEFEYTQNGEQVVVKDYTTETKCEVPVGLNGQFIFRIQAQKVGDNNTLNSQFETTTNSILVPNSLTSLEWLDDEYKFKFTTASDFSENDVIEITCSVYKYIYDGSVSLSEELEVLTYQLPYNKDSGGVYYFAPAYMGQYSVVSARVRRGKILSAGSMAKRDLDLHLFSAGNGNDSPYVISSIGSGVSEPTPAQQLLNIKYRPNAKFVLKQSVDLTSSITSNYDGVLANEFGGELDGGGFAIKGFNANVNNSNFSLFKTLNGATIFNLILGADSNTISATYSNFANVYLAVLAQNAANSTIKKIEIKDTTILASGSATGSVYVAGLIAKAQNTKILGCVGKATIDYSINLNANSKYVGGMVASAEGGEFGVADSIKTSVNFTLISSNVVGAEITYLGGLVGEYHSQEAQYGKITSAEVTVNMATINARNAGGLVGYSRCNDITNCVVKGTISTLRLNSQANIKLAGLVGVLQSSKIDSSKNEVEVTVNLVTGVLQNDNIRVGILVGEISVGVQAQLSSITNCSSSVEFKAGKTELGSNILGVYGYLTEGTISGEIDCKKV